VGTARHDDEVELTLTTRDLALVGAFVDGHPAGSISVEDGETTLSIQLINGNRQLELKGFDAGGVLAAAWKEKL